MIPVSVSDILKLLDQIPIWKAVAGMPKRLGELEARIAALEPRFSPRRGVPLMRLALALAALVFVSSAWGSALVLTAANIDDIILCYKENEMRFERDFKGKTFKDTVLFTSIHKNIFAEDYSVYFVNGGMFGKLECRVAGDASGHLANLTAGNKIILSGKVENVSFGAVVLENCVMGIVGPD